VSFILDAWKVHYADGRRDADEGALQEQMDAASAIAAGAKAHFVRKAEVELFLRACKRSECPFRAHNVNSIFSPRALAVRKSLQTRRRGQYYPAGKPVIDALRCEDGKG